MKSKVKGKNKSTTIFGDFNTRILEIDIIIRKKGKNMEMRITLSIPLK